jgi:hypothetical protein
MTKKIDLGVSKGPSAAELSTIRAGNAKTKSARRAAAEESIARKSNVGPEQASAISGAMAEPKSELTVAEQRAPITQRVITETEQSSALKGGRHNATLFEAPYQKSDNPLHSGMAKHLADFITHGQKGNRAGMEAARAGFHALRGQNRGTPKGMETPCTGPSCTKAMGNGVTSCGEGGCSTGEKSESAGVNVSRPRG